jgi:uncharacterized protein (DUF2267 family)
LTKRSIRELNNAVRTTTEWIDDLMLRLGRQDRDKVYAALIAALHALRDWLPRDEAIYIAACFPPLLRGLYYEGWHAAGHVTAKSRRAFLERIQKNCMGSGRVEQRSREYERLTSVQVRCAPDRPHFSLR